MDMILTSPPFALTRKKDYGNEQEDAYLDWFRSFAVAFRRILKDDGSLVIDLGGAWKPGLPVRSLYHFKLLIMLCEEYGFHLAQEFYWWNPSKLPTPAEWVNIRRVRVKDAVNTVWWLAKSPWPRASNRRVLQPYSDSMKELLSNGYKAKLRPSGHDISDKFARDNGAAIPPNLIAVPNTESNSRYLRYCAQNDIRPHPARFPGHYPSISSAWPRTLATWCSIRSAGAASLEKSPNGWGGTGSASSWRKSTYGAPRADSKSPRRLAQPATERGRPAKATIAYPIQACYGTTLRRNRFPKTAAGNARTRIERRNGI